MLNVQRSDGIFGMNLDTNEIEGLSNEQKERLKTLKREVDETKY
jgi:hypothetical protein